MTITESELKKQIKEGRLQRVYFFYGEETYLSGHYAAQIAAKAVGGDELAAFNLQKFDGRDCTMEELEDAAEALPLMAESKCVVVRDYDAAGGGAANQERLLRLVSDPPESCVLVFWQDAVEADVKKNAKWKAFAAAVEKRALVWNSGESPRRISSSCCAAAPPAGLPFAAGQRPADGGAVRGRTASAAQ